MIVGVHQPNYLPYLGFFDKMKQSDVFIIYDDAQFSKGDFQHRNRIRIYHGWMYLTVPVEKKTMPINEIKIRNEISKKGMKWSDVHLKNIRDNYNDSPYYMLYESELEAIYADNYDKLIDLNMEIISFLMDAFNIRTKFMLSSELGLSSKSTERLVEMIEIIGGDVYLSGPGGRNYLDISLFEDRDIKLEFQDFKHPVYKQCYKSFIPNMCALDALFNTSNLF